MARTINDIKTQALNYLSFPVPVDFETPDEVGAIINRVWDDVLEKAYRMYPWSFARFDGIIQGTKDSDQQARFSHYATISTYLTNYICMQAAFYDAKHWAKCFDWKQYGTDTIKFMPQRLFVEYTASVPFADMPAYFVDYLAIAVAVESCAPLRLESKLPVLLQQMENIFLDARKQDSMNEPAPASFDNIIDEARNIL